MLGARLIHVTVGLDLGRLQDRFLENKTLSVAGFRLIAFCEDFEEPLESPSLDAQVVETSLLLGASLF